MKTRTNPIPFADGCWQFKVTAGFIFALVMGLFSVGCGKNKISSPETQAAQPTVEIAQTMTSGPPVNSQPPEVAPAANTATEADLRLLTQALRRYAIERRGMPKTFAELVSAGYLKKIPGAPPGKKFEISSQTAEVILVNQ